MPKITSIIKIASVSLALAALFGCGRSNGDAAPGIDNGQHPGNWVQQHWVVYKDANGGSTAFNPASPCAQCHGTDANGGITKVSCFSQSFNGQSCHANLDGTLGHPAAWASDPSSPDFHANFKFNGVNVRGNTNLVAACGICHDTGAGGTAVGGAPSCLTPSIDGVACHATSPAATASGCTSCHGGDKTTGPTGAATPNTAGAHAAHLALYPVITCGSCHFTYGTQTLRHGSGNGQAFLNLSGNYKARSGSFSFNLSDGTCVGASCHGGQQTPKWTGPAGTLTVTGANCTKCHVQGTSAGVPQYNSYYSGSNTNVSGAVNEHVAHLTLHGAQCVDCHSLTILQDNTKHLNGMATPAFDTDPESTISGSQIVSYDGSDVAKGSCTNNCHAAGTPGGADNVAGPAHWNQ